MILNANRNSLITHCCVCDSEVETKKVLPFRNLIGSGVETYNMHIAICNKCGFIFQQNPLTAEQLENRYKNQSKFEFDNEDYFLSDSEEYKQRSFRQKHFIDENIGMLGGGYKSVLEVGAASGYNLSLYEDKQRLGIEPSKINCTSAKKNYNLDMFNGMWDEFLKSESTEKFDLIFLSHVLEHIVNPLKFIQECSEICNKYIFIEVPCLDIKFVDEPYGIFAEEHVNIFTIQGLWNLMNKAGFIPVDIEMIFGLYTFLPAGWPAVSTIWKKSRSMKSPNLIDDSSACLERYIKSSESFLQQIELKISEIPDGERLAVWGVGHHISMLLANTTLKIKNIVRVYDSDKRKHSYKVLNVSITPFNKEDILSGEVEAILITTYTAQKAISKAIKEMNLPCKIYTLYDI